MSRAAVEEVHVPASAVPAFSERLWTPIWVYLLAFAFGAAMATAIALSGPASLELAVLSAVGLGLVFVLIFAFSTTLRRIHFDGIYLRLGFGEKIDLRWVTSIAVVDRDELQAIRKRTIRPAAKSGATLPLLLSGPLGFAAGQFGLAGAAFRGLGRRAGMICAAWTRDGVHVETMPGQITTDWLIGSRKPEQLAAALREGVAAAQKTIVPWEPEPQQERR